MKKRLLVTGAGGFVGGSVVVQASTELGEEWEVRALSRKKCPMERRRIVWRAIDVLDFDRLALAFREIRPDAAIHAAAIADIDYCEAHPEEARRVNVELTRQVLRLSEEAKSNVVFVSTDTIFDGQRGNYREEDAPGPVNLYAETKVEAENLVRAYPGRWVIARAALVMGLPLLGEGNSFLPKMILALKGGKKVGVPAEEIRSPIDVVTLGRALLQLAAGGETGVFHLAGNEALPRVEMARRIASRLGYAPDLIFAQDAAALPGRAPRPRDASLNNERARRTLRTPMLALDAGLDLALAMLNE